MTVEYLYIEINKIEQLTILSESEKIGLYMSCIYKYAESNNLEFNDAVELFQNYSNKIN